MVQVGCWRGPGVGYNHTMGRQKQACSSSSASSSSAPVVSLLCMSSVNAGRRSSPAARAASRPVRTRPTHARAASTMPAKGDARMRLPTAAAAALAPRRAAAAAAATRGPSGDAAAAAAAAVSSRPRLAEKKKRGSQIRMAARPTPSSRRAVSRGGRAAGQRESRACEQKCSSPAVGLAGRGVQTCSWPEVHGTRAASLSSRNASASHQVAAPALGGRRLLLLLLLRPQGVLCSGPPHAAGRPSGGAAAAGRGRRL